MAVCKDISPVNGLIQCLGLCHVYTFIFMPWPPCLCRLILLAWQDYLQSCKLLNPDNGNVLAYMGLVSPLIGLILRLNTFLHTGNGVDTEIRIKLLNVMQQVLNCEQPNCEQ